MWVRWIQGLAAGALALAIAILTMQVVLRFAFNQPYAWAEEVTRYLFVWTVFLGAIVGLVNGSHVRVDFLSQILGSRFERFSRRLGWLLNLVCYGFAGGCGYQLMINYWDQEFYTIPFLPRFLFFASLPVCFTIMVVYLVVTRRP